MLALYDAEGSTEEGVEIWWMNNAEASVDEKYLPNDFIDFDDDYSDGDLFPSSLAQKLRKDFQGYRIWKSYTGEAEAYTLLGQWDIKDAEGEKDNGFGYYYDGSQWVPGGSTYPVVTLPGGALDLQGSLGYDTGLPTESGTYCWGDNPRVAYKFTYANVPQYVKDAYFEQNGVEMPQYIDAADTSAGEWVWYKFVDEEVREGSEVYYSVTAFDRGMPSFNVPVLESGKDANRQVFFPGQQAAPNGENVYVIPNPYLGRSEFDGQTDVAKRIWFVNLPETCTIRIYTLSGDLVQTIEHDGPHMASITSARQAVGEAITSSGVHEWNMVTRNNQSVASGVYLYSIEDEDGNIHVDKFVLVK